MGQAQADSDIGDARDRRGRRTAQLYLPFVSRAGWD
jgi:hypothetical protein